MAAGTCVGFTCSSCLTSGYAAYRDGYACVTCDSTTSGLDTTAGDCTCAASSDSYYYSALADLTTAGDYATNKSCSSCRSGEFVVVDSAITTSESTLATAIHQTAAAGNGVNCA